MRDTTDFNLVIGTQDYIIGSGAAIDIAKFKDARWLSYKKSTDVRWQPVSLGEVDHEELDLAYDEDDEGPPEAAIIDNVTLKLYPPNPDLTYNMRLYHYNWTDNPAGNTQTDDLLDNFGVALVDGAIMWGYRSHLKDLQGSTYWENQLKMEILKINSHNFKRDWKDKVQLTPRPGPGRRSWRSTDNLQIYGSRIR
jgi:hypothetical protein